MLNNEKAENQLNSEQQDKAHANVPVAPINTVDSTVDAGGAPLQVSPENGEVVHEEEHGDNAEQQIQLQPLESGQDMGQASAQEPEMENDNADDQNE